MCIRDSHIDGETFHKVQLKGRLTLDTKYNEKNIYIAFNQDKKWYFYPHDKLQKELLSFGLMINSSSWNDKGSYSWPKIPKNLEKHMEKYAI